MSLQYLLKIGNSRGVRENLLVPYRFFVEYNAYIKRFTRKEKNMELIRISDTKLKVMLSEEDMILYDLDTEALDYDNKETRRAFWQILDEAKRQTGFDASSDRVFVQVYPSKKGGCEMFVTKVGKLDTGKTETKGLTSMRKRENIYSFDCFETTVLMCEKLKAIGYEGKSSVYTDQDRGVYYLVIEERSSDSILKNNSLGEYGFLSEYGKKKSGGLMYAYIKEHFHCLDGKDAVNSLSL